MGKLPAFQFYPADWRKDPGVQSLPYHDRGVWFEILCLMHESEQRGKLLLNGKAMPEDALARLLGLDKQIVTKTLTTLIEYGVASYDQETGALICRRMVRDEGLRKIRQEAGKMGGNPVLVKQKSNQKPTTPVKQKPTPSSSSSSSSSSSEKETAIAVSSREPAGNDDAVSKPDDQNPIVAALEQIYPGSASNYRTMRELFELAEKLKATPAQVLAFPEWIQANHPRKADTPYAFRDLFDKSLKGNRPIQANGLSKQEQLEARNQAVVDQITRKATGSYIDAEVIS